MFGHKLGGEAEISWAEFEMYYEGLSLGIDEDADFENILKNSWSILFNHAWRLTLIFYSCFSEEKQENLSFTSTLLGGDLPFKSRTFRNMKHVVFCAATFLLQLKLVV